MRSDLSAHERRPVVMGQDVRRHFSDRRGEKADDRGRDVAIKVVADVFLSDPSGSRASNVRRVSWRR